MDKKQILYKSISFVILLFSCCLIIAIDDLKAQNQQESMESSPISVVSYFKCKLDAIPRLSEMTENITKPILDRLVREDKLLGWGALSHYWGDEWSFIIYYNAASLASFEIASGEFFSDLMENNPDWMTEWSTLCSEHKDNIYTVVNGSMMQE